MRREPGLDEGQDGFMAVDALVAITILSSSLALSLAAVQIGVRASRAAAETHDAELVLRGQLELTAGRVGVWRGRDQGLDWRVEARLADSGRMAQTGPCIRTASAKAVRTGRAYRLGTVDTCLAAEGASGTGA